MIRRIAMLIITLAVATGCDGRPEPTRSSPPEKRSDVHIQAPGVKIDIQKKER